MLQLEVNENIPAESAGLESALEVRALLNCFDAGLTTLCHRTWSAKKR